MLLSPTEEAVAEGEGPSLVRLDGVVAVERVRSGSMEGLPEAAAAGGRDARTLATPYGTQEVEFVIVSGGTCKNIAPPSSPYGTNAMAAVDHHHHLALIPNVGAKMESRLTDGHRRQERTARG